MERRVPEVGEELPWEKVAQGTVDITYARQFHKAAQPSYRTNTAGEAARPLAESVPPITYGELARRIADLEEKNKKSNATIDEQRNQLAQSADTLREEHSRDMHEFMEEMAQEMNSKFLEFRRTIVTPMELEVNDIRENIVASLKLDVDRALVDLQSNLDEAVHSLQSGQQSLQAQMDQSSSTAEQKLQSLQAEQNEHAEAIGTVMDLIMATATQESLDQTAAALQADLGEHTGQMQESLAKFDDILDEIHERLQAVETGFVQFQEECTGAIDIKLEEANKALTEQTTAALNESAAKVTDMHSMAEQALQKSESSAASLEEKLEVHVDTFEARLHDMTRENSEMRESVEANGATVLNMSAEVKALDAKLESTSQVLDQKVELTAEEMDRQLAATKASLEVSLVKAARETTDRIDSGDKAGLSKLADVRQELSTQVHALKQRMTEFESGGATKAEKDIAALRDKLHADIKEMRTSINEKTTSTAADVDQKLEGTLKKMVDHAENSKLAIETIETLVGGLTEQMEDRYRETVTGIDRLRKDTTELIEKETAGLTQLLDVKTAHNQTEQKRETAERMTSMKEFKATLTRDISAISSRVDEQHSTFSEMTASQERLFMDKATALDAMLADHHSHFSSLCTAMEQRLIDKNAAVIARTEDLTNTVNMHHHNLSSLCTSMETKSADRMQNFDRQLENTRSSFADSCAKLDTKLAEQKQKLNDTLNDRVKKLSDDIQGTRTHLSQRQAQDLDHFQQRIQDFEEKMRHKQLANDTRVDGVIASLQATDKKCDRLDGSITQVGSTVKGNRDMFSSACASLEQKVQTQLSAQEATAQELRKVVTQHYTTLNEMCGSAEATNKTIQAELRQLTATSRDQNQRLTESVQLVDKQMKDQVRMLNDKSEQLEGKLESAKADFDSTLKGQQSHLTKSLSGLDSKMSDSAGMIGGRVKDVQEMLSARMDKIDLQSKEKDTEHDRRFAEITDLVLEKAQEAAEMSQGLRKQAVDDLDKTEERITGVAEELRDAKRELIQTQSAQQKQIEETMRLREEEAAEFTDKLSRGTERIDTRVNKLQTFLEERVSAVQKSLSDDREDARGAVTKLDKKLTDRITDVETCSQTAERKLATDIANLTKKTDESVRRFETTLSEDSEEVHAELKSLSYTVGANHQVAKNETEALDQKYTELFALTEDRMTKQRDGMTEMLKEAESTLASQQDALQTALKDQHGHFTLAVGDLNVKFSEAVKDLEAELGALNTKVEVQNDSFSQTCEGIVVFAQEENAKQDKRAGQIFQDLDDACKQLDAKIFEAVQMQDERMESLRGALNSTDLKVDEKNSSQDSRVDQLNDALEALTQQVADSTSTTHTATQSVASKLADVTADLTGSIETGLQALNQRIDSAEKAQQSEAEMSRAQVEAETAERTSAIEAVHRKISTESGRLDSELAALHSLVPVEVQRLENKLDTEVTGLKHQSDAESERIDRVIDEKTHDLSSRLTNDVGSLTMQLDATDSKFTKQIAAESQSIGMKLQHSTDTLSKRLTSETKDLRTAVKDHVARLEQAQNAAETSFAVRVDQEVIQLKSEISDAAGKQEARCVSVEQTADKALAESTARLERRLEDTIRELKTADNSLKSSIAAEKRENGTALRTLGKHIDEVDSARKTLDTKVQTMEREIAQAIATSASELAQEISRSTAEAQARDASQSAQITRLESEVSGKLASEIAALESKVKTELSPLTVQTARLDLRMSTVEQLASRADKTSSTIETKVGLQDMTMQDVQSSIQVLDSETQSLEQSVESTKEEVSDLATDVVIMQSLMSAESGS